MGWLLEKYGIGILGDEVDVKLILRANKLVGVYRVFSKLAALGVKHMSPGEFMFIRDVIKEVG